jgi:hypothetical protein
VVLEGVGDRAAVVVGGVVDRHGLAREADEVAHDVLGELDVGGNLVGRRLAVEPLRELARRAGDAAHHLDQVDRHADRARLVGQ